MQEIVYLNRDNSIELELIQDKKDGNGPRPLTDEEMQAITRIDLAYLGSTISSQTPGLFDWTTRRAEAIVIIKLGAQALAVGSDISADLYIYDNDHPNGLKWATFTLKVEQG